MNASMAPGRTSWDLLLTGPAAQVVLAVLEQALLRRQGTERLLVGVKGIDGRFTVLGADAKDVPQAGRLQFPWGQAAPVFASLRLQLPGGPGSLVECGGRHLYRYSRVVDRQQLVLGALLSRVPENAGPLHAAVSSAVHTLSPESDRQIPDACVSVSIDSHPQGFCARVAYAGEGGLATASAHATTIAMATARATVEASGAPLQIRFADQIMLGATPVALIVADSAVGAVIGCSNLPAPGTTAPALAVLKAAHSIRRIEAEVGSAQAPRIGALA